MTTPTQPASHGANAKVAGVTGHRLGSTEPAPLRPAAPDEAVLSYLRAHCRGRDNAIKQKHIAAACSVSVRELQDILKTLTEERGIAIASSCSAPMGVFIPETKQEAEDYANQLRSRALSCFKRIRALSRATAAALAHEIQGDLFGGPGCMHATGDPSNRSLHRQCDLCGAHFTPATSWQRFCSDEHRDVWHGRKSLQ